MHGKGEFSRFQGSICNIPIAEANICNGLPRLKVFNLIHCCYVKIGAAICCNNVYFEPVRPLIIYQALPAYLKSHNKFY